MATTPPYTRDDTTYLPFRDDTYRAIGRYVVEYSRMLTFMRDKMAYRFARPGEKDALEAAFGEMTAYPLTNAFFASCAAIGELDDDERKIGRSLRAQVLEESERRNDIAHGDWTVAQVVNVEPRQNYAELRRLKPAKAKVVDQRQEVLAQTLDGWSDEVHELALMVATFGQFALGIADGTRVRDRLAMQGNRVIQVG